MNLHCKTLVLFTFLNICIILPVNIKVLLISFNFSYIINKFKDLNVNKKLIRCLRNLIHNIHRLY